MAQYMIAVGRGLGKWVPTAYPSTPRLYRQTWMALQRDGETRLLGFRKVVAIGGVWAEADNPTQPMTPTEAWVMLSNDDHFKMMRG